MEEWVKGDREKMDRKYTFEGKPLLYLAKNELLSELRFQLKQTETFAKGLRKHIDKIEKE